MSSSGPLGLGLLDRLFRRTSSTQSNQTSNNQQTPEDMTGTQDSGPVRRTIGCRIQVAVVLDGRGDRENINLTAIEDALESNDDVDRSFNVNQRAARIEGDAELLLITRGSILSEQELENAVSVARTELLNQPVGLNVQSWRVEAI